MKNIKPEFERYIATGIGIIVKKKKKPSNLRWLDYLLYDEDENVIGLKDDTPPKIRKEYEEWIKLI